MSMYEAYFDESYDGSRIMAVAGYLLRAEKAKEMNRLWKEALKKYNLPYFHMVDCAHGAGLFKNMGQRKRSRIAADFIALTSYAEFGISAIVNPVRFNKANTGKDPYIACVDLCVLSLCAWLSDKKPARVAFFLEAGHASAAKSDASLIRLKHDPDVSAHYASHTFAGKEEVRLLQAADLLAWQSTKFMKDKVNRLRRPRRDFMELLKSPHAFHYLVFHNNSVGVSIDEEPHIPYAPRDDYLRAMFSYTVDADRIIEATHGKMIFRQQTLGDVVFPESTKKDED